jgi:secreted trypsin-like serine protease
MQLQQAYGNTQSSSTIRRNSTRRYMIIGLSILCSLLIISVFLALFIIYFIRYRNTVSSLLSYPNFVCNQHPCGCPNSDNIKSFIPKIVGGQEASPYIYPWLVTLTDKNRADPFCAGFIISSNTILTAAHCLTNRNSHQVQILARIHDLRDFKGDRHDIDKWIIHPEYRIDDSLHLNDLALIKIKQSFAKDLQPCCLPSTQSDVYPLAKTKAVISGWGKISVKPNNRNSPVLQHVVMPIVDDKDLKCRQSIADTHRQVCAGYDNLSIDACSGDSGAPLLVVEHNDNQSYFVAAGIVSYGNKQCDASISSGVYTRISFYLEWIYTTRTYL